MASFLIPLLLIGPIPSSADSIAMPANLSISADIGPNAEGMIRDLTARLGLTVDQLMPYYHAQALVTIQMWRIGCWVGGVALLLCLVFIVCACFVGDFDNPLGVCVVCSGILAAVLFFVLLDGFSGYMTALHNPDLWVVRAMMHDAAQLLGGGA